MAETHKKILDSVFPAPGCQYLRPVESDVDLSFYEGTGTGPDMEKIKAAALGNITLKNNQG